MAKSGKRLRKAKEKINLDGVYTLTDAVKIVKENANTNFDETIILLGSQKATPEML